MSKGLVLSDAFLLALRQMIVVEDFRAGAPADWTGTATSGTSAGQDEPNGVHLLTTQAADNAIGTLVQAKKVFSVAAGKPFSIAAYCKFAEGNTNAANVLIGVHSGTPSSALADNGGGPPSSYSGFAFFKADGDTVWSVESSNGSTQVTTQLTATASLDKVAKTAGSSSYVLFEIDVIPKTSTLCDVIYKIDGVTVAKHTDFVYTSIAAMAGLVAIKAGSGTAESIRTDFFNYAIVR